MVVKRVSKLDPAEVPDRLDVFRQSDAHEALCARTPTLHQAECDFPARKIAPRRLRIGVWNLERCKHLSEAAALLSGLDLDVILLCEMDDGMARSGNLNTTRLLAESLGMTYAFGVEFIETGHGTDSERALFAGQANSKALHGNAILSRFTLSRVDMLRLPGGEVWTDMDWHDPRLGSRIALGGTITTEHGPLAVVSVHFESLPGPVERAGHMRLILDWIDRTYPKIPVLLGGDLNSAELPEAYDLDSSSPPWFLHPEEREPMFAAIRATGYGWLAANTAQHTRRQIANGRPFRPFKKVDWLFVRGLLASAPAVHPAVDPNGRPISDHELLLTDIEPAP